MENKKEVVAGAAKKSRTGLKVVLIVCACVLALLVLGYGFLCFWASSHVLPNSGALGIELGGMSREDAVEQMENLTEAYHGQSVTLQCGDTEVDCQMEQAQPTLDQEALFSQVTLSDAPHAARGILWLEALLTGERHEADGSVIDFANEQYVSEILDQMTRNLTRPVRQHAITVTDECIVIDMGEAGMSVNLENTGSVILEKLLAGETVLEVEPEYTQPDKIGLLELYRQVYVEPVDAHLDPETYEPQPHVNGISFDMGLAYNLYTAAAEGEQVEVPLIFTEPELTQEELQELLFADVLGQATSWISGTANRLSNVRLAGRMCNETILLPGDEFSYWSKIAPCNAAQGFLPAPTYLKGESVDGVGGGICQMSSSIYYAAFHANLEIVERNHHSFAVGYLPDGGDAMVSEDWSDFRFKNNTEYPIKIVVYVSGRNLNVQILGTKTDDTYVRMETIRLETTPWETVYEVDPAVPVGTTKETVSAYTGRKVEAYRCVYSGDGKLISRTLESLNNYKKRDQVIAVNPADAWKYGLDENGNPLPEGFVPTPSPEVTPPPEVTPAPEITPAPEVTPEPAPEVTPEPAPAPSEEVGTE